MQTTFLTEKQVQTLRAAVNRVIPADDYPNGWDAGVGAYLAALLIQEPRFIALYQTGLDALDTEAGALGFAALAPEAQDILLTRSEADHSPFFQMLVTQTMEGFYADPANGGNHGEISWQMLGFEVTA